MTALTLRAAVIHWHPDELADKVRIVQQAGALVVVQEAEDGRRAHQDLLRQRPDLLVVWTTWKPAHSRMLTGALRAAGLRSPTVLFVEEPSAPLPSAVRAGLRSTVPEALFDQPSRISFWVQRLGARQGNPKSVAADDKPHVPAKDWA